MSKYSAQQNNQTTSTSVKTGIMLWALTNRRAEAIEAVVTGSGQAAVADIPITASIAMASTTAVGVGSTITPEKFAQGSAAANSCSTTNFTQEPTTYGTVFPVHWGFNSRGGQRWAVPQGEGVKVDSGVTQNRLGLRTQAQSGTPGADLTINWWED